MAVAKTKKSGYRDKIKGAFMNQKKLSQLTGIDPVRISNVMTGTQDFDLEELKKIGQALNIKL